MKNALIKPMKTFAEKQQLIVKRCKDKTSTDKLIKRYQTSTKGAIEHILNMGVAVKEVYELSKSGQLNEYDLNYFCMSVGISQKSSMFRKYKAIGEKADKFMTYLDKMPSAFTSLYEIATLEADLFEEIFIKGNYGQNLTLKQIRQLANKKSAVPNKNSNNTPSLPYVHASTVAKFAKDINKITIRVARNLKDSDFNEVIQLLDDLQKRHLIEFEMPTTTQTSNDEDDGQLQLAA